MYLSFLTMLFFQQEKSPSRFFKNKRSSGVSIVEVLLVVSLVGFLVLLISNTPSSINLIGKARKTDLAREIALKQIEAKRELLYVNLTDGTSPISDPRLNQLPAGSGQIIIGDCDLITCPDGNAKKVTSEVFWKEAGKTQSVKFTTIIAKGGLNQ